MNNISIRKMRIFVAAVEEKSFSKAALRENISQPAATIITNEIEETLGLELFQRRGATRKAILTPRGEFVAKTFSRIIAGYDSELNSISAVESKRKEPKRILIQSSLSNAVSGRWLASIAGMFEDCHLIFETAKRRRILEEISGKSAILGVIDGRVETECSDYLHLGGYKLVAVEPEPEANELRRPAEAWTDWLAIDDIDPLLKKRVSARLRDSGFEIEHMTQVADISLLARLMRETRRPAIIPDVLLPNLASTTPCRVIEIDAPEIHADFGVVTQWGYLARIGRQRIKKEHCLPSAAHAELAPKLDAALALRQTA